MAARFLSTSVQFACISLSLSLLISMTNRITNSDTWWEQYILRNVTFTCVLICICYVVGQHFNFNSYHKCSSCQVPVKTNLFLSISSCFSSQFKIKCFQSVEMKHVKHNFEWSGLHILMINLNSLRDNGQGETIRHLIESLSLLHVVVIDTCPLIVIPLGEKKIIIIMLFFEFITKFWAKAEAKSSQTAWPKLSLWDTTRMCTYTHRDKMKWVVCMYL